MRSIRSLQTPFRRFTSGSDDADFSFAPALPSIAAAQRASLGRGLALVLVLTVSCLVMVYGPMALDGSAKPEAGGAPPAPQGGVRAVLRLAGPSVTRTLR